MEQKRAENVLVCLAVETSLLNAGRTEFERVESLLEKKHHITLMEAHDNPEILCSVLRDVFGDSYGKIIRSIEEFLADFRQVRPVDEFIAKVTTTA